MGYRDRSDRLPEDGTPTGAVEQPESRRDPWSAALGVEPVRWRDFALPDEEPAPDTPADPASDLDERTTDSPNEAVHVDHLDLPTGSGCSWREMPYRTVDGFVRRPPLFDGPPKRDQARQGQLGDCGVIATLGAVASHRPEELADLVKEGVDGDYSVRLHQVEQDEQGGWVPSGRRIEMTVSPEVPVPADSPEVAAFADTATTGCAWAAVLEKAIGALDLTWDQERAAATESFSGYDRLDRGSDPWTRAELMAQLTGRPAGVMELDTTPGREHGAEEILTGLIADGRPVIVGVLPGDRRGRREHGLYGSHAYEVVAVNGGEVTLWNPWGDRHPEIMTIQQLLHNIRPEITTLVGSDSHNGDRVD